MSQCPKPFSVDFMDFFNVKTTFEDFKKSANKFIKKNDEKIIDSYIDLLTNSP